ncbi:MAG: hypothetical protein ACRD2P_09025 [Terriglobia bacterium]
MAAPVVNTPFHDPDFGSRMVRVTDANTLSNYGGNLTALSFMTDSSQEANTWGAFDPSLGVSGGYRFVIDAIDGGVIPFTLDAATMNVSRPSGQPGSYLNINGMLDLDSATFSYVNPALLYGVKRTQLLAYDLSTDSESLVYDFAACPGLPSYVSQPSLYRGEPSNSADDTKFGDFFGGANQGETALVTFYDRSANNGAGACYWYDTQTGMVGGTGMAPTPVANQVGQLPTPAAPQVTPNPGAGSLPAGDYYVRVTAVTQMHPQNGETAPSEEVGPVYLSAPGSLTITFPAQAPNPSEVTIPQSPCSLNTACGPFNVYIGAASGGETLQSAQGPVGGGAYLQTAPLVPGSAPPPSLSTAGYNVHGARLSRDGSYLRVDPQEGQTEYFWRPGTNQVTTCLFDTDACGGHLALGYSHLINDPNNNDMAEVLIRPLSNLSTYTELVNPLPQPAQFAASHWTWNDDNPSDTMPVCGSFYNGGTQGDGLLDALVNPLLLITRAYDREVVCVATTGPTKIWRFAHTRASTAWNASIGADSNFWATPRGNVSQDGKFYMFTSDWEWSLGNEQGSSGCPFAGECRTDVFIVELH